MTGYQQFLELIHPQPGFKVLDITTHADELTEAVLQHLQPFSGHRVAVAMYPGDHKEFAPCEALKLQEIPNFGAPFRALPRDNDVVIIRDVLHRHTQTERILKSIYTTLANTGDIIIVTKDGDADVETQKELLEKYEFRSANSMDILEGYTVVTAKKMHMWGNGL